MYAGLAIQLPQKQWKSLTSITKLTVKHLHSRFWQKTRRVEIFNSGDVVVAKSCGLQMFV
jgi:hypothetical protein